MVMYRGRMALITGASGGIGAAFARALAARGMALVLVARGEGPLRALAAELAARHGVRAEVVVADLADVDAPARITAAVAEQGLTVDLLVNNAGFGAYGPFAALDAARDHRQIMVNVAAVVGLAHAFVPAMAARGEGAVINVASLGGFQPAPYLAVYGASKAFVLSFSQALWAEYRRQGVQVLALCPGPVRTGFFDALGSATPAMGAMLPPERVVAAALRALEEGRGHVVPGWPNALLAAATTRLLPRGLVARLAERSLRPRGSERPASRVA